MGHCLSAIFPCVDDNPVAIQVSLPGQFVGHCKEAPKEFFILHMSEAFRMHFGNDQDVHRGLGVEISKGCRKIVFI